MKFEELSEGYRKTLGVETKDRLWGANYGGYSWVISYLTDRPKKAEDEPYLGYTATYRRKDHNRSSQTIAVEGGPFKSFKEAEDACKRVWRQIRTAN